MKIKVNESIHAKLLHDYFWDLEEIAINLEESHPDLENLEVVNVTNDVVTIKGYQAGSEVRIYSTVEDNVIEKVIK